MNVAGDFRAETCGVPVLAASSRHNTVEESGRQLRNTGAQEQVDGHKVATSNGSSECTFRFYNQLLCLRANFRQCLRYCPAHEGGVRCGEQLAWG
jgi:hypothetical protein